MSEDTGNALRECFISPNVSDSNMEAANIVDVGNNIAKALWAIVYEMRAEVPTVSETHGINEKGKVVPLEKDDE